MDDDSMNNSTKRYPRTLEEAFGPYARGTLADPDERTRRKSDRKAVIISAIAALFVIIFAIKSAA